MIHKDGVDDDDDGEDEDILAGLMNSGLNSIPDPKSKMQKRSKQPIKREHLKDVNIIEYIDKKMNEAASGRDPRSDRTGPSITDCSWTPDLRHQWITIDGRK